MSYWHPTSAPPSGCISSRSVEVCYVQTGSFAEHLLPQWLLQLTSDERVRAGRFVLAKDRLTFALGRVLVRKTLSRWAAAPPCGWNFTCNSYGKPTLSRSPGVPPFCFNISHCTGMVAAAFGIERNIGVDTETLDRKLAAPDVARRYFAPEEASYLESLPEQQRTSAFFSLWTLKEAYIKGQGRGLSIPLADFSFALDPIRISFSPRIKDQPSNWLFRQQTIAPSHVLALAAGRQPEEELSVCVRKVALESLL